MNRVPDKISLGKYSLQQRDAFLTNKISKYLEKHPEASKKKARKYARVKWYRKLKAEEKKLQHPNKPRVVKEAT